MLSDYTNEFQTVLDPYYGSCSTGVACLELNRNFIGIEKDNMYYEIGTDRIYEVYNKIEKDRK